MRTTNLQKLGLRIIEEAFQSDAERKAFFAKHRGQQSTISPELKLQIQRDAIGNANFIYTGKSAFRRTGGNRYGIRGWR